MWLVIFHYLPLNSPYPVHLSSRHSLMPLADAYLRESITERAAGEKAKELSAGDSQRVLEKIRL